jgi:phenylacetate-coenzyme A ligase PaaK-like adenylate-forming protein
MARIDRISRRTDDIIVFGGASILPSEVERVLSAFDATRAGYEIVVDRGRMPGRLHIKVEVDEQVAHGDEIVQRTLSDQIRDKLKSVTGADFAVSLKPPKTLTKEGDKNGRVVWD